jgi:hypothetical protein
MYKPAVIAGLLMATGVEAHHTVTVDYDLTREIELRGTVAAFVQQSPHSLLTLRGQRYSDGQPVDVSDQQWYVETMPPSYLRRMGITADSFGPGTAIIVLAHPNRDAASRNVTSSIFIDATGRRYSRGSKSVTP